MRLYSPKKFTKLTRTRFGRDRRCQLVAHLGRPASFPERIIIERVIALEWDLRRIDARAEAGEELSGHALRARLAAENRLRLDLRELGLKPANERPKTLSELLAEEAAEREAAKAEAGLDE